MSDAQKDDGGVAPGAPTGIAAADQAAAPDGALAAGTTSLQLAVGSGTDRGLRRELNEDSLHAVDPLFVVADGMGGHEAGEVASSECVAVLRGRPELSGGSRTATALLLQETLRQADARIRDVGNARAGTTATGAVVVEQDGAPCWLIFNVGDSRSYLLSQDRFGQLSVDHSEVQELVDAGYITAAEALVHPRRHVVTRALGTGSDAEADYWLIPIADGDRLLLCSDGLTGEVSDAHLETVVRTVAEPQLAVDGLIQAALRSGGRDNVTVIIVDATLQPVTAAQHPAPLATSDAATAAPVSTHLSAEEAAAAGSAREEKHD